MTTTMDRSTAIDSSLTSSISTATLVDLHDRLDSLWISYLHHLSEYTTAQTLLQKHMSAGFLSLARANFTPRTGIRRYGKDYFHDRAIASRRVRISMHEDDSAKFKADVISWTGELKDTDDADSSARGGVDEAERPKKQQASPSLTHLNAIDKDNKAEFEDSPGDSTDLNENVENEDLPVLDESSAPKINSNLDPLRWFGILVPPELRSVQTSFVSAVEESVASATNAAKQMRGLEIEIRRARKEIRKAEKAGN